MNNDIVTWHPVNRRGDTIFVAGLKGVYNAEEFRRVAASGGWICKDETDSLLWVDNKDRANGECNTS